MILTLIVIFALGLIVALFKSPKDNAISNNDTASPPKRKKQKVQPYHKYQKKVNQRKAKAAMFQANNAVLDLDEANSLLAHNGSDDEMHLLDLILDAKLDGRKHIVVERSLYERLKRQS